MAMHHIKAFINEGFTLLSRMKIRTTQNFRKYCACYAFLLNNF